jgi:hypothetical protein
MRKLHVAASGKNLVRPGTDAFKENTTCRLVIMSEAKDFVFMRFFGRFAPSE